MCVCACARACVRACVCVCVVVVVVVVRARMWEGGTVREHGGMALQQVSQKSVGRGSNLVACAACLGLRCLASGRTCQYQYPMLCQQQTLHFLGAVLGSQCNMDMGYGYGQWAG